MGATLSFAGYFGGGAEFSATVQPQDSDPQTPTDCEILVNVAAVIAYSAKSAGELVGRLQKRFEVPPEGPNFSREQRMKRYFEFRSSGFKREFREPLNLPGASENQVNHYVGGLFRAFLGASIVRWSGIPAEIAYRAGLREANKNERYPPQESIDADKTLNAVSVRHGVDLAYGNLDPKQLAARIRADVCQ